MMLDKINVWPIAVAHFKSLRSYDTRKRSVPDIIIFLVVPAVLALAFTGIGLEVTPDLINVAGVAVSVLAGLLFQLVVLIYTLVDKVKTVADATPAAQRDDEWERVRDNKLQLVRLAYVSTAFSILTAIIILGVILVLSTHPGETIQNFTAEHHFRGPWKDILFWSRKVLTFVLIMNISAFVVTLLMVLKRMHVLVMNEFPGRRTV